MEHSKNFDKINGYYQSGLWTEEMVHNVVGKRNGITPEEYTEITGQPYEE